jgi:hypothetical protein
VIRPSYERIHYALRPAKNIQRKMLLEVFRHLGEFGATDDFRYIGFGSTYFSDFTLFHRALGFKKMISIERDLSNRERFEFNRPFDCVDIKFGDSSEILPKLKWGDKTILWLDYDGSLGPSVLTDVRFFCSSAPSGSVIIVTLNAEPDELGLEGVSARLEKLEALVGRERIPIGTKEGNFAAWGTANIFRRIITSQIFETLADRNGALKPSAKIRYRQLFNFQYSDGAKMMTVGGLIYEASRLSDVEKSKFQDLDFVRTATKANSEAYRIEIPRLTFKEIRSLDRQLPRRARARLKLPRVPADDIKKYERLYRYFPTFAETEV